MVRAVWTRLFWLAGVALVVIVGAATPAQAATTDFVATWKIEDTTGGPMKATSAGQVRYFKVVRGPKGRVSVRTFGQPNLRLNVTQTAPATSQYTPFRRGATYLRGLRG